MAFEGPATGFAQFEPYADSDVVFVFNGVPLLLISFEYGHRVFDFVVVHPMVRQLVDHVVVHQGVQASFPEVPRHSEAGLLAEEREISVVVAAPHVVRGRLPVRHAVAGIDAVPRFLFIVGVTGGRRVVTVHFEHHLVVLSRLASVVPQAVVLRCRIFSTRACLNCLVGG